MLVRIFAAAIGIAAVSLLPRLDPLLCLSAVFATAAVAIVGFYRRSAGAGVALCLLLGICWSMGYGFRLLDSQLPRHLEQVPLWVTGTVEGLPVTGSMGGVPYTRFVLAVSSPRRGRPSVKRLRLSWRGGAGVVPGQHWRLRVKVKRPHGFMNPGGFDYQTWLVRRGIGGVGYVMDNAGNRLLGERNWDIDRWRWQLSAWLDGRMKGLATRPLLKALLIADRRDIPRAQWRTFQRYGLVHLMVISGLHIGLVSALVFAAVRLMVLLTALRARADSVAAGAALVAALVYCLAAGASLPTRRAFIMVAALMLARLRQREGFAVPGLAWALLACLLVDPLAVVSPSFWLSFGAVLALAIGLSGFIGERGVVGTAIRCQWSVFIGLMPVLAVNFGQVSLSAPLLNLLAIPLFSLLVVPLAVAGLLVSVPAPALSGWCWQACDALIRGVFDALATVDRFSSLAPLDVPALPTPLVVLAAVGALLWIAPAGIPLKRVAGLLLLPILCFQPHRPSYGELNLTVLDVGQGLSVVVETAAHVLVYDVGARYREDDQHYFSLAEVVLVPFLRSRGIHSIDTLVLSHGDNDHAGGWADLVKAMPVDTVIAGETLPSLVARPCLSARPWYWEGVRFQFLPAIADSERLAERPSPERRSGNSRSCVLSIRSGDQQMLLPGDIEAAGERRLVARLARRLRSSVLVAPHHGSHSSSTWPFVKRVRPAHVVFSSGYLNAFGHPHRDVVARYQTMGAILHNTAEDGAVQFRLRGGKLLTPTHYRARMLRYWL